ncbi:MAG: hypothetical protein HY897_08380 [Deltaproteobacteria bacterium]|nr:hypothetical protein [Deltaproteobacteria bacterium]
MVCTVSTRQRTRVIGPLLLCACACVLWACPASRSGPVSYRVQREYSAGDYEEVLTRWTRRADIYRELQSEAFIAATFKSPDFRRAFVSAYAKTMDLPAPDAARLWAAESAAAKDWHEITVVMYTTDRKWNDLDTRDSVWRVRVLSEATGAEAFPAEVTSVKELSPQMRKLYPQATPFTRFYFLRFPKKSADGRDLPGEGGGRLRLELVSGLGKAVCSWEFAP